MERRMFITLVGGAAAALPLAANAQKPIVPVIGVLESGSATSPTNITAEFHAGLKESGFVEGQNVTIEYRRADAQYDRLPEIAADLAGRHVAVIAASGAFVSPLAAKSATGTIPIVFLMGADPVARHAMPAMFGGRDSVLAGGLIAYGGSYESAHRQFGIYVGRILRGEKPADLPVLQPTKFDLIINLNTAKTLGLTVPKTILAQATEVIE
jgi:ABC-type uncharacterized transport system substrate-binding protein